MVAGFLLSFSLFVFFGLICCALLLMVVSNRSKVKKLQAAAKAEATDATKTEAPQASPLQVLAALLVIVAFVVVGIPFIAWLSS